jgi:hypothetical protein
LLSSALVFSSLLSSVQVFSSPCFLLERLKRSIKRHSIYSALDEWPILPKVGSAIAFSANLKASGPTPDRQRTRRRVAA